ncbi:hypothetical protein PCANC_19289 [Puccinia coronata f. sp. avenae]|uniref:Uncharacterized protein n=1 Tax=Puccinia coronata f. sp. avenae TaxID=200324 RepID=A0A2N5UBS6_9BASI|nr:hypothetical protein PCANC_19289 [Puccinia coronata f. sp. avenae]
MQSSKIAASFGSKVHRGQLRAALHQENLQITSPGLSAVACLDKAPLYSDGGVGTVVPAGSLRPLSEGPCGTTYKALYTKFSRTLRGHL